MKNFRLNKNIFIAKYALTLALCTLPLTLGGCGKDDCEVENEHAHLYINDDGLTRYIASEKENIDGYAHQEDYIELDETEAKKIAFANKNNLINVFDNMDAIKALIASNEAVIRYEYVTEDITTVTNSYNLTRNMTGTARYEWTDDPDMETVIHSYVEDHEIYPNSNISIGSHSASGLTGNVLINCFIYQSYNIEINDGKCTLVKGPLLLDINDITEEYPYIEPIFDHSITFETFDVTGKKFKGLSLTPED